MTLTEEQLLKVAAWEPSDNRFVVNDPVAEFIRPALSKLTKSEHWQCHIVEDGTGGLSNYYSIGIHKFLNKQELSRSRHYKPHKGVGILVNLSLMVPVGAIGRTAFTFASGSFGAMPLNLDSIIAPVFGIDEMVDAVLGVFQHSIYRFLDRDELSQRLPPHIRPFEYCYCAEPWDRVFHVLFANTD